MTRCLTGEKISNKLHSAIDIFHYSIFTVHFKSILFLKKKVKYIKNIKIFLITLVFCIENATQSYLFIAEEKPWAYYTFNLGNDEPVFNFYF